MLPHNPFCVQEAFYPVPCTQTNGTQLNKGKQQLQKSYYFSTILEYFCHGFRRKLKAMAIWLPCWKITQ